MTPGAKPNRVLDTLKTHKILADTSFLMDRNFTRFLDDYAGTLHQNHMLVPKRVLQELQRIESLNDHRRKAAQTALASIQAAVAKGMAEIRGEASDDDTFADNVISRVVEQHIVHNNIVVLTNDRILKNWVYAKKRSGCFSTKNSLIVIRFGPPQGNTHVWRDGDETPLGEQVIGAAAHRPRPPLLTSKPAVPQPFVRAKSITSNLETKLPVRDGVEKAGELFLCGGRSVRLIKELASGGEGAVFETDQANLLCKVYHPNRLTIGAQKKIELMCTRKVCNAAICWPREPVLDQHGTFRGFLMPRAYGEPLGHGLFIPTVWRGKRPNWTRRESAQLAIRILEQIDYLHRMRVLLGDINPMNILVHDEKTIYFVDCDSFQVEGFPCPVGSPNFVAPEIQGVDFSRFLRTEEHELFAVATLLFMIMMPGKCPYSHRGGEDGTANIRKMHFPYRLGEKASAGAPEGAWPFCWSHLTWPLKEAFHQSFHEDSRGQPRISVVDWLRRFREYERILGKDAATFVGPVPQYGFDLAILPHNFRYVEGKGHPLPSGGETDLQRSVRRMAISSVAITRQSRFSAPPRRPIQTSSVAPAAAAGRTLYVTQSQQRQSTASSYASHAAQAPTHSGAGSGTWYANPLVWAIIASPLKALLEVVGAAILMGILGGVMLGTLGLVVGAIFGSARDTMIGGIRTGAAFCGLLGLLDGLLAAARSIFRIDRGILPAVGLGGAVGAIAFVLFEGSEWWGAFIGVLCALLVWRLHAGEQKAAQYMQAWRVPQSVVLVHKNQLQLAWRKLCQMIR